MTESKMYITASLFLHLTYFLNIPSYSPRFPICTHDFIAPSLCKNPSPDIFFITCSVGWSWLV
jgi:hypothetical protein